MIEFEDGTVTEGAAFIKQNATIRGSHHGAVVVERGAHLLIAGSFEGALRARDGAHITITGLVQGAVTREGSATIIVEDGGLISGPATRGIVGPHEGNEDPFDHIRS